ncbi:hypothetical protein [Pedobacter boryungensis]|uniref:DUF3955 domain-containing protein n=1 Tax=Pedobacter boryungensis TaxID=869962 RepID=A0ABX2DFW5_9SPHI|nr:hypothetical protein [Pedobacter boryungensis]NQX32922.1 hypothetical protein [Pedobacter boryungensis]
MNKLSLALHILGVFILSYLTFDLFKGDFALSVIPGWHTTIYPPYFIISCISLSFAWIFAVLLIWNGYFRIKKK